MTHEFNDDDPEKIHSVDQINKNLLMEGTVRIDKGPMTPHPTNWGWELEEDSFGLPKGANKMYWSGEPTTPFKSGSMTTTIWSNLTTPIPLRIPWRTTSLTCPLGKRLESLSPPLLLALQLWRLSVEKVVFKHKTGRKSGAKLSDAETFEGEALGRALKRPPSPFIRRGSQAAWVTPFRRAAAGTRPRAAPRTHPRGVRGASRGL
jgi:hypothetical protein